MSLVTYLSGHGGHALPVMQVSLAKPFVWLGRGWEDLRRTPGASLAYGLLVSVLGAVILGFWRHPYFIAAAVSGFLLVGPLFAAGLCELSRRLAAGEPADFDTSLSVLAEHRTALIRFSSELLAIGAIWFAASTLMLYLALGSAGPGVEATMWGGVLEQLTRAQMISYAVVGGLLACVVFARSVVAVPLIIDRHVDSPTAVRTSIRVTLADLPAMILWAALIVILVAIGFATFLVGMVAIFPLLGHATWHAYRDLVK
ncbi:DUF2189 domain-containing protein [Thiocapsa bogorovii]|uniref:DUF2189 domain-containing protein n=1 Tax=Thiocapsa bogorovii TaxID=521689 RepID=UPI001E54901F|nr:DUF2189 domain-containing protein [Thiocapsa bogorovii]UHD17214.1 DUF2189 domain-containing protein [Thiocapsa bogorovii]